MIEEIKVINWIAVKNAADRKLFPEREKLTQLRLMKLLYFIQGTYLALYREPMFDEKLVHAPKGPLAENAHQKYKGKSDLTDSINFSEAIKDFSQLNNTPKVNIVLNAVYDKFADVHVHDIIDLTHSQKPWIETPNGSEISRETLESYFRDNVVI